MQVVDNSDIYVQANDYVNATCADPALIEYSSHIKNFAWTTCKLDC